MIFLQSEKKLYALKKVSSWGIPTADRSSLFYKTSALREQHECDSCGTIAIQEQYEQQKCDTNVASATQ